MFRIDQTRHPERARWGKPLEGVRVLAIEQMQALPHATQLMAQLGADVVKVEHPVHGESGRGARPAVTDEQGRQVGATYLRNNLGKRSIGIDLKQPEGVELIKRLVPRFDIVGENFRPGTLARLGLGYDVLGEIDPRVILVSVSGFGNLVESPYASWPAYAPIAEAMAGFLEMAAGPEAPLRLNTYGALGDIGTGLFAVIGALSALQHRQRTGLGQHVDVAMFDAMVTMADLVPFMPSVGGPMPREGGFGLIEGFRCKDGRFVIEVIREHQLEALAGLLDRPDWLQDPRLARREDWDRHVDDVFRPAIEDWAAGKTKLEACDALCRAGVAAGPSNTAADLYRDPHVEARGMLLEVERPDGEPPFVVSGNPVKLSRTAEGPLRSFPRLNEHTDEVLTESLGLDSDTLTDLRERGVIG